MISSRLDVHTEIRDARCSRSFCNASTDSDEVSKVIRDLVGPAASLDVVSYAPEAEESYPTAVQQERTTIREISSNRTVMVVPLCGGVSWRCADLSHTLEIYGCSICLR